MGNGSGGEVAPPAVDPTPGLTNISASLDGNLASASCEVENPAYITNGEVTFYFTSTSHSTSAICNVDSTQSSAEVKDVELEWATTYTVYATCKATNGTTATSPKMTLAVGAKPSAVPTESWLELPAEDKGGLYPNGVELKVKSGSERNYTAYYDKSTYTSMWVAYPLESKHMGSLSRPGSWSFNPLLEQKYQVDLCSASYSDYPLYARGHLIPNASRNGIKEMQEQTFYVTNSVPQIQDNFNSGMWSTLEAALQSAASKTTLYIVTGVAFAKSGETKTISYTTAKNDTKKVPIPNYFYKVVLKVKTNSSGVVTSASTVGFWFENKAYSGTTYSNYTVSVDQVEQWTGFDFFANLPDSVEANAEKNTNWNTFSNF